MSGVRFVPMDAWTKTEAHTEEIDGGMLIVLTDRNGTIATIYQPPSKAPPTGFSRDRIYYQISGAWPTSGSLTVTATKGGTPTSSADEFKAAAPGKFEPKDKPVSSGTKRFMYTNAGSVTWGVDLSGITETLSEARGNAVWWSDTDGHIPLDSTCELTLNDNTPGSSGTSYFKAMDTLG
ncbi:hypothetical protein ACSRUE_06585 [Sorangium sp. KYC3313]|uniref:hypothetical protein n=1 Tax=Sorangium sp. KYC3313 TaxID=3449740 RepID=UPI003F8BE393